MVPGGGSPRQSQALDKPELIASIATAVESKVELSSIWRMKLLMASALTSLFAISGPSVGCGALAVDDNGVTVLVLVTLTLTTLFTVATRVEVASVTVLHGGSVKRNTALNCSIDVQNGGDNDIDGVGGPSKQSLAQFSGG